MRRFLLPLCLLGLCSCLPNATESQVPSSKEELLVYISNRGNGFNLYANDKAGKRERMLTQDPGWEWDPRFLADRNLLIYNSQDTSDQFSIKAIEPNGSAQAFDAKGMENFVLTQDGSWFAFTRKKEGETHIWIAPYDHPADSQQVSLEGTYNGRPLWSHDGKKLAYISDRTGSNELFVYNGELKETIQITDNELREKYLSWSPDDQRIATTLSTEDLINDIYLIELESKAITRLTETPFNEQEISWSLAGDHIAYHTQIDEKDDIYIVEISTGTITQITHGEGYHGEPTWMYR